MNFLDGSGLFDIIVDQFDLRKFAQYRLAVPHLELQFAAAANHLLGGHSIGHFRESSHEFDAPAQTMKVLKPLAPR